MWDGFPLMNRRKLANIPIDWNEADVKAVEAANDDASKKLVNDDFLVIQNRLLGKSASLASSMDETKASLLDLLRETKDVQARLDTFAASREATSLSWPNATTRPLPLHNAVWVLLPTLPRRLGPQRRSFRLRLT